MGAFDPKMLVSEMLVSEMLVSEMSVSEMLVSEMLISEMLVFITHEQIYECCMASVLTYSGLQWMRYLYV